MLFNLCGPHHSGLNAHLDAVTFRGIRIENSPVWLQNVMGSSGLFTDHLVKMAQVITWWYLGENGTFTYWPDGPLGEPTRLEHPLWNKGVVVQNEMMFHRGDPVGRPDERDIRGLKHRSLIGYDADRDDWAITTDGEVIRRYRPEQMRLLVHWSAEVYAGHGRGQEEHGPLRRPHASTSSSSGCSPTCAARASTSPSRPTRCTTATSSAH